MSKQEQEQQHQRFTRRKVMVLAAVTAADIIILSILNHGQTNGEEETEFQKPEPDLVSEKPSVPSNQGWTVRHPLRDGARYRPASPRQAILHFGDAIEIEGNDAGITFIDHHKADGSHALALAIWTNSHTAILTIPKNPDNLDTSILAFDKKGKIGEDTRYFRFKEVRHQDPDPKSGEYSYILTKEV